VKINFWPLPRRKAKSPHFSFLARMRNIKNLRTSRNHFPPPFSVAGENLGVSVKIVIKTGEYYYIIS